MPPAPRAASRVVAPVKRVIPIAAPHLNLLKPPIKAWSFSSLGDFERCRYYSFLKRVQKIPEPERELPPGKLEHANDRGTRIHDAAEMFVRGTGPFDPGLKYFQHEFEAMAKLFKAGKVSLEGEWGMNREWEPEEYAKAWLRLKLDALVFLSPTEAIAIDYKTGRIFGNEVKHAEQLQLYQLVTFLRYPQLEVLHTELWYLDHDEIKTITYMRHQGMRFRGKWDQRGTAMTSAVDFPHNANAFSCKYCLYGRRGSGVCEKGV